MLEEESLVRRAQAKDAEAFVRLYEAYFDKVYRYVAVRIGNALTLISYQNSINHFSMTAIRSYTYK